MWWFMRAGLAFLMAAIWWLADRLYGDEAFEALRPMIPDWLTEPTADMLFTWVPVFLFAALAIAFIWLGYREKRIGDPLPAVRSAIDLVEKRLKYASEVIVGDKDIGQFMKKLDLQDVDAIRPREWSSYSISSAQKELTEIVVNYHYELQRLIANYRHNKEEMDREHIVRLYHARARKLLSSLHNLAKALGDRRI